MKYNGTKKIDRKGFDKITKSAIKDKHQVRPEDLQRASVLFYSVNQLGFAFVDLDINAIIESRENITLIQQRVS